MTPAITAARQAKLEHAIHEYDPGGTGESWGLEAAGKLAVAPERVFKTLVVQLDGRALAVAVIPVSTSLSMKRMARAAGGKKAAMARPVDVERSTGYVLGGVSPLGQKRRLPTFVDASAQQYKTIFISAGRRGLELELDPGDLVRLVDGCYASLDDDARPLPPSAPGGGER